MRLAEHFMAFSQRFNKFQNVGVKMLDFVYHMALIGSAVVECLTRDREAADSSLTSITALWSLSKTHLS